MDRRRLLSLLLLPLVAAAPDAAAVKATCKNDVTGMISGLVHRDFGRVADLTHPTIVARMGGRAKMVESLASAAKQMAAGGMAFESGTVDPPADPVAVGSDLYTVVEYTVRLTTPRGAQRQRAFVIGQSHDGGRTWTYVNGDLGPDEIKTVLPGLPPSLKLPQRAAKPK